MDTEYVEDLFFSTLEEEYGNEPIPPEDFKELIDGLSPRMIARIFDRLCVDKLAKKHG